MTPKTMQDASAMAPKQRRSRESHERILATAERLLRTSGTGQLTLATVSRTAGVSVGGIYRRFKDREALIRAVQERLNQQMSDEYRALEREVIAQTDSLETRVAMLVAALANHLRRHIPLIKAVVEASRSDPVVAARGREVFRTHLKRFSALVLEFRRAIAHPDPDLATRFCFSNVYELVASHFGVGGRTADTHERWSILVANLQRLCIAFLTMPAANAGAHGGPRPTRSRR